MIKNLPAMQKTLVLSLGQEDPLEKEMATHSSILTWRIPWTEEPSRLQSTGSQRLRYNWASNIFTALNNLQLTLYTCQATWWTILCSISLKPHSSSPRYQHPWFLDKEAEAQLSQVLQRQLAREPRQSDLFLSPTGWRLHSSGWHQKLALSWLDWPLEPLFLMF